jgi:hypothetical protein
MAWKCIFRKLKSELLKTISANGEIYCKHLLSGDFVKMNSLNLSWMPKYIFPLLHRSIMYAQQDDKIVPIDLLKAPSFLPRQIFASAS